LLGGFLSGVFINEFLEGNKVSFTFIGFTFFVSFWIPFKGWVSSDLNTISFIDGSIEFGNDNVWSILVGFTELIPNWGEFLAVSTPWGIEFNKNILGWVLNDFIEFGSNNDNNITLGFWCSSRFKMGLNRSIFDSFDECSNLINSKSIDITFKLVFLHASWEKSSNSWIVLFGNSDEFSEFTLNLVSRSSI
jgi:hypothetical protein